jgi:hypothetical protein
MDDSELKCQSEKRKKREEVQLFSYYYNNCKEEFITKHPMIFLFALSPFEVMMVIVIAVTVFLGYWRSFVIVM